MTLRRTLAGPRRPLRTSVALCLLFGAPALLLAGCADTPQQRGPFHQYLHEHGLE